MIIVYPFIVLVIFYIIGTAAIKLLKLNRTRLVQGNIVIPCLIGFIVSLSILETMGLIVSISITTYVIIALAIVSALYSYKNIVAFFHGKLKNKSLYLILFSIPIIIIMLPQIVHNELFLVCGYNNDFAYYLSSIDWLKNHTILEPVMYSHAYPFYSMAEYMLHTTRIGTDLVGAFVGSLFSLESYQVFSILAPIAAAMIFAAVYSATQYFIEDSFYCMVFSAGASVCGDCIALIAGQYVPQIFGAACLVLALAALHELFSGKDYPTYYMVGLSVGGMLAVYCEFTIYIVATSIVFLFFSIVNRSINIKNIAKALAITVIINVFGFFRAVQFNLNILRSVMNAGTKSIDPYGGQLLSRWRKLGVFFGMNGKNELGAANTAYRLITFAIAIFFFISVIALIRQAVLKRNYEKVLFVVTTTSIFIILEYYFISKSAAYEEYKHLTSAAFIMLTNLFVSSGSMLQNVKGQRIVKSLSATMVILILSISLKNTLKIYMYPNISVNSENMELRDISKLVPNDFEIGLDSSIGSADYMSAVYALKDHAINLDSKGVSYLQFFQTFDDDNSKYTLYPCSQIMKAVKNGKIIWLNKKYVLTFNYTNENFKRMYITGLGWNHQKNAVASEEADCVMNVDGSEGLLLYGPYIPVDGIFNIKLEYTIKKYEMGTGYFDVYDSGMTLAKEQLDPSSNTITLKNVKFNNNKQVEFRVYSPKGNVIKVEGILFERVE